MAKRQSSNNILRDAFAACARHLRYVFFFSATLNLLYLAPSLYMLQVYDRVLTSGGILTLLYLSAVLVASLGVLSFLDAMRMRILAAFAKRFDRVVAPHLLMAAMRREGRQAAGQAHILREFDTLRTAVTGPPAIAAADAPWTPLYIAACYLIHPWIGSLALGGGALLVLIALANQWTTRRLMKAYEQSSGALYALQMSDSSQAEAAHALGMELGLVRRQLKARESTSNALNDASASGALFSSATKFVRLLLQSTSLGLGAYLAVQQEISAGGIIAASILTARAYAPLELIVGAWRQFEQGGQAYAILRNVLRTQETQRDYTALPNPRGRISAEGVALKSPAGDRFLLMGASVQVEPGEILGVVGPSGAGKTTLMRALAGAAAPDQGTVRLDGAKLSDWDPETRGRHIGYLPQEVALFAGTIRDNIARFGSDEDGDQAEVDAAVVAAAQAAGAHELILSLPRGYDTELGQNGRGLSAGQAQRVALARALYRDPVILILDEPNAHLDSEGENALLLALSAAKRRGAAIVVVAHRTGVINIADKLMVIQGGRVDSVGPREQIQAKLSSRPVAVPPPVEQIRGRQ